MSRESIDTGDFSGFVLSELSDTGSKDRCTDQSTDTTNHMDRTGTGKIMEAKF